MPDECAHSVVVILSEGKSDVGLREITITDKLVVDSGDQEEQVSHQRHQFKQPTVSAGSKHADRRKS